MPALDREQVARAVKALLQHERAPKPGEKRKAQLFEDTDHKVLSLVVGMKEQPRKERTKAYPIRIPHSLHAESEICILVKDPQKKLKERLESEPVDGVVKIIGLRKLRDNYKTFEAKRNLCDSYDLFMADRRILPMLPKLLGNSFFQKKKCARPFLPALPGSPLSQLAEHAGACCRQPVPINIATSNAGLRINVAKARDCTQLWLGDGPCSMVKVAHTAMDADEMVDNIMAAADGVAARIPKKWANIQALHIKTPDSVALPIFASLPEVTALPS
eukprot:COSAG04_NODE_1732_length_5768_cov_11.998236_4_plen_274_part_00